MQVTDAVIPGPTYLEAMEDDEGGAKGYKIEMKCVQSAESFSVSIQDTLYALYTILHHGAPPKYYKYYIVLNFILSATFPSKLC